MSGLSEAAELVPAGQSLTPAVPLLAKTPEEKAALKAQSAAGKLLSEQIKRVFLAPFTRTMRYLYSGISPRPDVFILGTDKESKFRYGNPDQALGLVYIKNKAVCETIAAFLLAVGVESQRFEVIGLADISTVLNKCKWDLSRVCASRNAQGLLVLTTDNDAAVVVSEDVQTLYTFQKIKDLTAAYVSAQIDKAVLVYDYPYRGEDLARLTKIVIDIENLRRAGFGNLPSHGHLRMLLTRGLDWLYVKDLAECKDSDFLGLRIWCPSGSSFWYMHTYDTAELLVACTRCNFFLLPYHRPPV